MSVVTPAWRRSGLRGLIAPLVLLAVLAAVPFVVQVSYVMDVLIITGLYVGLALSYDLVVGYVGSLSLAHPAFFGIGAYTVALFSTKLGLPTVVALAAAALLPGLAALAVGIPSFRLSEYSFAIGTLGFATVAQLLAQNWIELTEGPMCVTRVPKAEIADRIPPISYWTRQARPTHPAAIMKLVMDRREKRPKPVSWSASPPTSISPPSSTPKINIMARRMTKTPVPSNAMPR